MMLQGLDDDDKEPKVKRERDKDGVLRIVEADTPLWRMLTMLYDSKYTIPPSIEKGDMQYHQQLLKYALAGAVNEQLSYVSPFRVFQDIKQQPNTYWMQANNIAQSLQMLFMLPSAVADEGTAAALDKTIYSLSRNMPLVGAPYRQGHEIFTAMTDDIDNNSNTRQ
jgi:hypothetical protein